MQDGGIKLYDIKPIVEVEEYSFYFFLAGSFFALFLFMGMLYLFFRWYKKRTKNNKRKDYLNKLKKLNLNEAKSSAYSITFYGALFKDDSPKHSQMFKNIILRLENYKYKKEVEPLDKETLNYIKLYKEMIEV